MSTQHKNEKDLLQDISLGSFRRGLWGVEDSFQRERKEKNQKATKLVNHFSFTRLENTMVLDFQQQLWVPENNVVMCIEFWGETISNQNCYSRIQR